MPSTLNRSKYEERLARAHRAVYHASIAAQDAGDDGAAADLGEILKHLTSMGEASLRRRPQLKGQLTFHAAS